MRHLLILLALASLSFDALANGAKFPTPAYPAMPSIPAQRALIVHRDGVETLIVESSYDTPSPDVAWVLPLPAEPMKLEAADPGLLTSMLMSQRPVLTHDLEKAWQPGVGLAALYLPFALATIFGGRKAQSVFVRYLVAVVFVALIISIMLPALGPTGPASAVPGVDVNSTTRVGSYDVSVLRAASADDLSAWLTARGFIALPEAARPVVADYVARKWCFAVAALRREGPSGTVATPHPIAATFPATAPVFPMRLTSLAGSTTRVDLFVVGGQQATADGFRTAAAALYRREGAVDSSHDPVGPAYRGDTGKLVVGHPGAVERMWDACVLTHLSADLAPAQMTNDVTIGWTALAPHRGHAFSERGRRELCFAILGWGGFGFLLVAALLFEGRRRRSRPVVILVALLGAAVPLAAAGVRLFVPAIEVREGPMEHPRINGLVSDVRSALRDALWNPGRGATSTAPATLPTDPAAVLRILRADEDAGTNRYTGQPVRIERSPGNVTVEVLDGAPVVTVYDADGRPHRVVHDP